ncbi:alpha/beta-hydrolase [Thozetella sp. PMI_491]|nr:alpha/beta-hydrolase [Thozetella sp. PMI_491]
MSNAGRGLVVLTLLVAYAGAAPSATKEKRFFEPVVTISNPEATIVGASAPFIGDLAGGSVESFKGIPFAKPPVGALRLKPPQPLTESLGRVDATTLIPASCPQYLIGDNITIPDNVPPDILKSIVDSPLFKSTAISGQEDCLTVNVQRPAGVKAGDKLPVILWIFGGGFELGSTGMYDATGLVANAMSMGKPFVFAAMNYRVGGFGFLGGKEILADGSANLGLLDQRLAMQWVADNIDSFGGDPEKVTLWGESAGAISIFDQMIMFNGDNTYKGKPLFRGAIMDSGSAVPTDNVDCPKAQAVYDAVVDKAGCSGKADTLACLREVDYQTFLAAANSVPGILSFNSLALSYLPRPDGKVLVSSPEATAQSGKVPEIPFILGDQEDEGTLFALFTFNLSTTADVEDYLNTLYFNDAGPDIVKQLVATYPDDPAAGSPFDTGDQNAIYPQFKRVAALLGDATFTLTRRAVFNITTSLQPKVKRWSYLASYDSGTPILGTFHGSDLIQVFYGIFPNFAAKTILGYYLNFAYNLDPNDGSGGERPRGGPGTGNLMEWPEWSNGKAMMNFDANSAKLITDDFRQESFEFILANAAKLHF